MKVALSASNGTGVSSTIVPVSLTSDLVEETSEISQSPEPRQNGTMVVAATSAPMSASASSSPGVSRRPAPQNTNFKLVKVASGGNETVEETIQKYVANVSSQHSGQQIIILKYSDTETDDPKTKTEPDTASSRRQTQQNDDGMWMEVEVPMGSEVNVNDGEQQTIIVEEMPVYFSEGSQVVEYHIASTDGQSDASGETSAGTKRSSTAESTPASKRQKKDALLAKSTPFHKCSDCGETFVAKYKLLAHRKIHAGKEPYACDQCGEMFPVRNMLSNHLMQHSGELTCQFCGRVLSTKRSLQRHMAQHTGDKEYKCHECDKDFFDRIQLVEHIRTHTGEKPFACQVCGTAFARNSNLLAHMRIHRDEKPYHCDVCGREFRWRNNMVLHQKKHVEAGEIDALLVTDPDDLKSETDLFAEESNGTETSE